MIAPRRAAHMEWSAEALRDLAAKTGLTEAEVLHELREAERDGWLERTESGFNLTLPAEHDPAPEHKP